jgi:hypothetical protein
MEAIMTTSRVFLALLFVSAAVFAISCNDQCNCPPPNHQTHYVSKVIRDYQYLDMTYFDLVRRDSVSENDLLPGDSITELDLYFSVGDYDNNYTHDKHICHLWVDPFDTTRYANENVKGTFVSFTRSTNYGTFYFHPTEHYIIMSQSITDISIGAYIKYRRWINGDHTSYVDKEIGSRPDTGFYTLKLIANANPQPSYVTWNYVWRNVYSLDGRIDDPDNLQVNIFKGNATNTIDRDPSDPNNQQGISYIHLLGLDSDNTGQIASRNPQIVDRTRGHLRFPSREPFANPILEVHVDTLYHTNSSAVLTVASKYYLLMQMPVD